MIHTIRLLLEGGQRFWQEEQPVSTVLELNELFATHQFTEDDRHYVHIDSTKTAMESMYDWRECALESDTLCWRTFHVILDGDHSWITVSDPLLNCVLVPILKAGHITR